MATTTSSSSTSSNYVPPISIPGIGTSIDVNTLVTSLMKVESQPLTQLQNQQTSYQTQLSAVGTLKSALSTFQSALSNLTSTSTFSGMKASGYDTSVLNASLCASSRWSRQRPFRFTITGMSRRCSFSRAPEMRSVRTGGPRWPPVP